MLAVQSRIAEAENKENKVIRTSFFDTSNDRKIPLWRRFLPKSWNKNTEQSKEVNILHGMINFHDRTRVFGLRARAFFAG